MNKIKPTLRLESNPRLLGTLFAATLAFLQVQTVAADILHINPGP